MFTRRNDTGSTGSTKPTTESAKAVLADLVSAGYMTEQSANAYLSSLEGPDEPPPKAARARPAAVDPSLAHVDRLMGVRHREMTTPPIARTRTGGLSISSASPVRIAVPRVAPQRIERCARTGRLLIA